MTFLHEWLVKLYDQWLIQARVVKAKKPETYPAKPRGGMSHGPPLLGTTQWLTT